MSEGIIGRLFGFGTVIVTSVGGQSLPLQFMGKPHRFKALLNEAVSAAKDRPISKPFAVHDDSRYMPKG